MPNVAVCQCDAMWVLTLMVMAGTACPAQCVAWPLKFAVCKQCQALSSVIPCSLQDLVAEACKGQEQVDRLADAADTPCAVEAGRAVMSAVAEQRTKLQVSRAALKGACPCLPHLSLQLTCLKVEVACSRKQGCMVW